MRPLALTLLLIVPTLAAAQTDSGTVQLRYEMLKGDRVDTTFERTLPAGAFPFVPIGSPVVPGRRVSIPRRLQGCARNAKRGTFNMEFNTALGPEGLTVGGPTSAMLSLQIGGYPWDRNVRYAGAATYPQDFVLGPRRTAKSWQFRPQGKRMWDQIVKTSTGGASVTINADERSGSFTLGPYADVKRQAWTVRGTFVCSRLMVAAGL